MLAHADGARGAGADSLRARDRGVRRARVARLPIPRRRRPGRACRRLTTAWRMHRADAHRSRDAFDQALTLVYRVLFLLFAEARALVPVWNDVYRDAYTIDALTRRAAIARHGAARGPVEGAPGDLASGACGLQGRRARRHRVQRPAVLAAACAARRAAAGARRGHARRAARRSRPRVTPRPAPHLVSRPRRRAARLGLRARARVRAGDRRRGDRAHAHVDERKTTGSFYTPRRSPSSWSGARSTPLVEVAPADEILALRIVDPAMGSGAFLVAACAFLADAASRRWFARAVVGRRGHACRSRGTAAPGRRAVPVRRGSEPDGGAARAIVAVADDAGRGSAADVSRSSSRRRQQSDRRAAQRSVAAAGVDAAAGRAITLPLFADQLADDVSRAGDAGAIPLVLAVRLARDREGQGAGDGGTGRARRAAREMVGGRRRVVRGRVLARRAAVRRRRAANGSPPRPARRRRCRPASCRSSLDARAHRGRATRPFTGSSRFRKSFFDADGQPAPHGGFDAVIGNPPWDMLRADIGSDPNEPMRNVDGGGAAFLPASRCYGITPADIPTAISCSSTARCS